MHVVLVDDEPAYRLLVRDALEQAGAVVHEAGGATAARGVIDGLVRLGVGVVLLTDYRMDGMSGLDLVAQVHGVVDKSVIMTSHSELRERGRALSMGVPMVSKPTTPEGLRTWIRRLVANAQRSAANRGDEAAGRPLARGQGPGDGPTVQVATEGTDP